MKKRIILEIVIAGMMASMAIVLDSFLVLRLGEYKITIYGLPLMFSGIMFGKYVGFLSGLTAGFVIQLISPYGLGPTTVLWMLAPIIWGGLSGILNEIFSKKYSLKSKNHSLLLVFIIVIITSLSVTTVNSVVTYLDSIILGYSYQLVIVQILIKYIICIIMSSIYSGSLYILVNRLKSVF